MDAPVLNPAHALRARQLQVVNLICLLLTFITQRNMANKKQVRLPTRKVILEGQAVREELLHNLLKGGQCRDLIRMSENAFRRLCEILQTVGGLRRTQRMSVEEHVARFLHISKPEAVSLKTKKIAYFDEMLMLFARDRASGAHAETAKERNAQLNKNENIQVETIKEVDDMLANNEIHLENEYVDLDDNIQDVIPPPFSQEQSSCAKKCKSKKRKFEDDDEEEDINSKIMKSVDNVAGAIREGNIIFDRAYPREYTGEEIYRELELVGLEPHELPRALNFLATNQAKARTLFSCPLHIRMGVLKDMMGARD
ncbi:unnamed protein product [Lactuca saligna]|uniref:DUF8040 domain-containing protein n=1 Tax=Lactuca saligna TaxID=75948 RepID=A0AA35Z8E0_LACSI|nr:unnamed protein product [Lactuca saligna]